ncbi:MAG TPA: hypothetical protein VKA10_11435 [Prolixibacteraceae bacterium]|nr:hypothetical protein [Prolixibacteraceae bacterium]
MRKYTLLLLLTLFSFVATAQYNFGIGVRTGGTTGIALKNNFENFAVEAIIGFWNDGISVTGLMEKTAPAFNAERINWYYGWGGHISVYGDEFNSKKGPAWFNHPNSNDEGDLGFGLDGVAGIELALQNVPFAFNVEIKPYTEVITNGGFLFWIDPGIGLKIIF